jgi:3-phenylpropionate/cinnamic acid dioxygenase small subunit
MSKLMRTLLIVVIGLSLIIIMASAPSDTGKSSYAEDRALIEDLQARYMFAFDFNDFDKYISCFTEDGIVDIVGMKWQGHKEIREMLEGMGKKDPKDKSKSVEKEDDGPYPATGRHNITNIVLKIDGDRATGRAYWFNYGNRNPERKAVLNSYGHYEDEMVKVNGKWLFSKRLIYNEQNKEWHAPAENPCW